MSIDIKTLNYKNKLIIDKHSNPPYYVVIGAPHQVPVGKGNICQLSDSPRLGDVNSGLLALDIFDSIKELNIPCKLVIKSRALYNDPNKDLNSDYSTEIFKEETKLLFEVHGQSDRNKSSLEFSAGMNDLSKVSKLILFLYEELRHLQKNEVIDYIYNFSFQEKPETNDAIIFTEEGSINIGKMVLPALKSSTITYAEQLGIQSMHLETTPEFRNKEINRRNLSKALSNAIYKYFFDPSFKGMPITTI